MTAKAEWNVTFLHPDLPEATSSTALSTAFGNIGGAVFIDGKSTPALWTGASSGSYTRLGPVMQQPSAVQAVGNGLQAGWTSSWAQYWTGGTQQYYLDTQDSSTSFVYAISGNWFGGQMQPDYAGPSIATVWKRSGTNTEAPILLRPQGTESSAVYAMYGATEEAPGVQVGMTAAAEGERRAAIWEGNAASYIDVHPASVIESLLTAVHEDRQGGFVTLEGNVVHAGVWSGSASSFQDYHPGGFTDSRIQSAANGAFAGRGWVGEDIIADSRALVWFDGTADPIILDSFLPGSYSGAAAESLSWVGDELWIAGWAYNSELARGEAVLWTYSVPEPSTITLFLLGGALLVVKFKKHLCIRGGSAVRKSPTP